MDSHADNLVEVVPADPRAEREALALAALAWPEEERAISWREIRDAAAADPDSVALLVARKDQRLIGAVLAHILPGRAAVVWPPQFVAAQEGGNTSVPGRLLNELAKTLAQRGAVLAQTLLAGGDERQVERMQAGGFVQAAELLYMSVEAVDFPTQPPELPFGLRAFSPGSEASLARLIDRTYEQTLDCPRIDGLRETADVIRGHQAVGEFRPELWQIAEAHGRDIGCLLVNLHPDVGHAELVYLGLVPEVRGRGYGLALTRHAQWLARQAGAERLVLAVDAANQPAIAAYERAGLSVWERRAIWIRPLIRGASAGAGNT